MSKDNQKKQEVKNEKVDLKDDELDMEKLEQASGGAGGPPIGRKPKDNHHAE
ncbi:MAG TPA: hypothetical protein PLO89_07845 [Spirochaetota bacterium]|nr:hypothetical protein [Spirochaetota bacterium]